MVRDPLGIRTWHYTEEDRLLCYLDFKNGYYSFTSEEIVISEIEFDPSEKLIGGSVLVGWKDD